MRSAIKKLLPLVQLTKTMPKYSLVTINAKNSMKIKQFQSQYLLTHTSKANFAIKTINVPSMGDSITEGQVHQMLKKVGDYVELDEVVCSVETDKTQVPIRSPEAGVITELFAQEGENVNVGKPFFVLDTEGKKPEGGAKPAAAAAGAKKEEAPKKTEAAKPAASAPAPEAAKKTEAPKAASSSASSQKPTQMAIQWGEKNRTETRVPLSKMRQRIGQRLKDSQNTYALLPTFNEVDMSNVMELRNKFQDQFQKKHNVKLGFMSFFVKAATAALQQQPIVNAVIDGKEIIYRNYIDISVAVATPTGLMVPVLRNTENMSFADVEKEIIRLGQKGKEGSITVEDMVGGTFTISNGGTYGSLFGMPILNPPQSAILGMHAVQNRPVVRGDQIVARPMMYLALTYDHRLIDGREAVTFLKTIKEIIEEPSKLLLEI
ncbi:hypothetical protein ABPG74_020570 [Tetrahymena malaccensis]